MNFLDLKTPWMLMPSELKRLIALADKNLLITTEKAGILSLMPKDWVDYYSQQSLRMSGVDGVAMVEINGVMSRGGGWYFGNEEIAQILKANDKNADVKAHLIKYNSLGGTVDSTKMLAETIAGLKKPKVAFGNRICSAAMMTAAPCNHIMLENQLVSIIGSIGVMAVVRDDSEAMGKAGFKEEVILADGSEDKYHEETIPLSPELIKQYKAELNPIRNEMVAYIKRYRAGVLKSDEVFTGKVYGPKDALALGLCDSVGMLDDAIKLALKMAS